MSEDEVAFGFIKVANEAMCRPIRLLTQARGFDTKTHVLSCFGGAGAQHGTLTLTLLACVATLTALCDPSANPRSCSVCHCPIVGHPPRVHSPPLLDSIGVRHRPRRRRAREAGALQPQHKGAPAVGRLMMLVGSLCQSGQTLHRSLARLCSATRPCRCWKVVWPRCASKRWRTLSRPTTATPPGSPSKVRQRTCVEAAADGRRPLTCRTNRRAL